LYQRDCGLQAQYITNNSLIAHPKLDRRAGMGAADLFASTSTLSVRTLFAVI
jgi:hypothetical protein